MPSVNSKTNGSGIKALYQREDSWAVWIGFLLIAAVLILWAAGVDLDNLNIKFDTYDSFSETPALVLPMLPKLLVLYVALAAVFSFAIGIMGYDRREFIKGFTLLFALAVVIEVLGSWSVSQVFNLETPVLALIVGMIIGNFVNIPRWFDASMRTEFYVKTGIVTMGATLPFSLIIYAGPVAFAQAACVSIITFLVIYALAARAFKLDKPFAAALGAGGSICGVSASIAVGSSVNAKKSHISMSITMVVIWATIMAFLLPIACRALGLTGGVAGAWIGLSEYADAAGVVAAARFGDSALTTFTLTKVLGRDMFVGVWSFIMAIVAVTVWEAKQGGPVGGGQKPSAKIIWERFPKFVLGFLIASIIVTLISLGLGEQAADELTSDVIPLIKNLRDWAFALCFLCVGMTTRFKDLAATGWKPVAAFSCGVAVNFVLGFLFSAVLLGDYWMGIA